MIVDQYNISFNTKRQQYDQGSTIKQSYQLYLSNIAGQLQPVDPSLREDLPGSFNKTRKLFCPVVDIKENDEVIIGNDTYAVSGVLDYSFASRNKHLEVTLLAP